MLDKINFHLRTINWKIDYYSESDNLFDRGLVLEAKHTKEVLEELKANFIRYEEHRDEMEEIRGLVR